MASLHSFFNSEENSSYLRNKLVDGEIGVFSADKYFSGRMDEDEARKANLIARRRHQDKKTEHIISTPQTQTPSVYSESSLNSQNALLTRPKVKAPKKKFLSKLRCNCACSDKNSVEVEEYVDNDDQADLIRIKRLQLQNLPCSANTVAVNKVQSLEEQEEERKSLEVFGSSQDKGSRSFNLERRLKTLAWDAIPKMEIEIEIQGPKNGESIKDTESEASSDLFEIECLSCSANPVVLPRHTLDEGDSSCVSPNCYAPSEASVEWSVVTASAADFSVVSDSEELASIRYRKMLPPKPKKSATAVIELSKPRYGGLLSGCKSQKAVRVAEDVYTTTPVRAKVDTPRITRSDSFTKMMNVGFGSKYRKDMLYIQ